MQLASVVNFPFIEYRRPHTYTATRSRDAPVWYTMESVQVFVENVLDRFRDPPPSLSGMDLGNDGQNSLMVSCA